MIKKNPTVEDIQKRVQDRMDERKQAINQMNRWEKAWRGDIWKQSDHASMNLMAKEQVVTPVPTNVVNKAMSLIRPTPRITVPRVHNGDRSDDKSRGLKQRWLNVAWEQVGHEQLIRPVDSAAWQSFTLGRHVMQFLYTEQTLPKHLQETMLPFTIRTLDPRTAGAHHNGIYHEYAWNKYRAKLSEVSARHTIPSKIKNKYSDDEAEVSCLDFWWHCEDGVRNCFIMDDEMVVKPKRTDHILLPIVEGYGDTTPLSQHEYRGLSIIHPFLESWLYDCRLKSQMATGILYYFWPFLVAQTENGQPLDDILIEPGKIVTLPQNTTLESVVGNPNSALVESMSAEMQRMTRQSTFADALFGDQETEMGGYNMTILANSAQSRIASFRANLESTIRQMNTIMLNFLGWDAVPSKGVTCYGYSQSEHDGVGYRLSAADVGDEYRTIVDLNVTLDPQLQDKMLWLRLLESKAISHRTFLEIAMKEDVPDDEIARIHTESMLMGEQMLSKTQLLALMDTFPDPSDKSDEDGTWKDIVYGTEAEQMSYQYGLSDPPPPPPAPPQAMGQPEMGSMPLPPPPGPDMGAMDPALGLGGPSIQPDLGLSELISPDMQGALTPNNVGMAPQPIPGLQEDIFDMATGDPLVSARQRLRGNQ